MYIYLFFEITKKKREIKKAHTISACFMLIIKWETQNNKEIECKLHDKQKVNVQKLYCSL